MLFNTFIDIYNFTSASVLQFHYFDIHHEMQYHVVGCLAFT